MWNRLPFPKPVGQSVEDLLTERDFPGLFFFRAPFFTFFPLFWGFTTLLQKGVLKTPFSLGFLIN
jgi:hypothetical protein